MSTTVEESSQQQQQHHEEHQQDVQQHEQQHQKKLEGEELLEAIRKQVEYYLSRQNLNNDPFLVSHMDKDLFVSVDIIANFKMMKTLTEDPALIMKALKSSSSVILDEQEGKMKPNFSISRNTVILRDIPSSTSEEEVKKLFAEDNQPVSVRSDIGDTWFVTFDADEQALQSLDYIRNKTFNDKAIKARIKSENLLKSFTQYSETNQGGYQPNSYPQRQNYGNRSHGGYNPHYYDNNNNRGFRGGRGGSAPRRGGSGGSRRGGRERDYYNPKPSNSNNKGPHVKQPNVVAPSNATTTTTTSTGKPHYVSATGQTNASTNYQQSHHQPQQQQSTPGKQQRPRSDSKGVQPRSDKKQGSKKTPRQPLQQAPVIDNTKNFPPLPAISQNDRSKSGYGSDEFIKYPKQLVVDIYANIVKDLKKPADLPADCIAVVDKPHPELEIMKPLTGEPVQPQVPAESVDIDTMISFAEAAITARDIKTPEITTEHLIPRRRSGSNAGPKTPQSGRKRSESNASNRSDRSDRSDRSRSSSSASNPPQPVAQQHIHRPEPIKPKKQKPQKEKSEKYEKSADKKKSTTATPSSSDNAAKKTESPVDNNKQQSQQSSSTTSYASVLQQE